MLYKASMLMGYKLDSLQGEMGKVKEFIFDDRQWGIRYLVADTGTWLVGRKVLICPQALESVQNKMERIGVLLTKKEIEESPLLEEDSALTPEYENDYYRFYGFPVYWNGSHLWGNFPYLVRSRESIEEETGERPTFHLHNVGDWTGHHIQAIDGEIGHVSDFLIDDETWAIRYLVIDTRNWWPGKKVLLPPQWIDPMTWSDGAVMVNVSRDAIQSAPEYQDGEQISREYEASLFSHYERGAYWDEEQEAQKHAS